MSIYTKMLRVARHPDLLTMRVSRIIAERRKAKIDLRRERADSLQFFSNRFQVDIQQILTEYQTSAFRVWYEARKAELARQGTLRGTTSDFDCETIYLIMRAVQPQVVIETGVLYGASSAHILEALRVNGSGALYSIDLPREPGGLPHDFFVEERAKERWQLILGDSRVELPALLDRLPTVDVFHHDSLHTFDHMWWEYQTAARRLGPGSLLTSHDVVSTLSNANVFARFCIAHQMDFRVFRNLGIGIMSSATGDTSNQAI